MVTEQWLQSTIVNFNQMIFAFMSQDRYSFVFQRRLKELAELELSVTSNNVSLKPEELQGRISGSSEWYSFILQFFYF